MFSFFQEKQDVKNHMLSHHRVKEYVFFLELFFIYFQRKSNSKNVASRIFSK